MLSIAFMHGLIRHCGPNQSMVKQSMLMLRAVALLKASVIAEGICE